MAGTRAENYYEARGFSVYYLANAVFNVVKHSGAYIRGLEDILGDMRTLTLMRSFPRYTNLHEFIREIATDVLTDEVEQEDEKCRYLSAFLTTFNVPFTADDLGGAEAFWDFAAETPRFHDAMDEITDEVFHVLFNDVGFLQDFNDLCSRYIESTGFGAELTTRTGCLKRVRLPKWARRAIFHRDKGECRACKRSLAAVINRLETERYDHIVPLACFGSNDVTNLQLLCEPCNLAKSAETEPVSLLYQRAFR